MSWHTQAVLFAILFFGLSRIEAGHDAKWRSLGSAILGFICLTVAVLEVLK